MSNSQVSISRAVRQFMTHEHMTQADLASRIGMTQSLLSRRLAGIRRWSIDDLAALIPAGVNLEPIAHAMTGRGEAHR